MPIENPWETFSYSFSSINNILTGDDDFVKQYEEFIKTKKRKYRQNNRLHLELFPEPFEGNPNAPIYLLGGNPGYDKQDIEWCNGKEPKSTTYLQLMNDNVRHKTERFVFFDERINSHKGSRWWGNRISDGIKHKIFNIEYIPYHSKKVIGLKDFLDKHPDTYIPLSNNYADSLIANAIKEGKAIVITRLKDYWIKRIKKFYPMIEKYKNLYVLFDHQMAKVDKGNIVKYTEFEKLKENSYNDIVGKYPSK